MDLTSVNVMSFGGNSSTRNYDDLLLTSIYECPMRMTH